jgi:hypothetical protein
LLQLSTELPISPVRVMADEPIVPVVEDVQVAMSAI